MFEHTPNWLQLVFFGMQEMYLSYMMLLLEFRLRWFHPVWVRPQVCVGQTDSCLWLVLTLLKLFAGAVSCIDRLSSALPLSRCFLLLLISCHWDRSPSPAAECVNTYTVFGLFSWRNLVLDLSDRIGGACQRTSAVAASAYITIFSLFMRGMLGRLTL